AALKRRLSDKEREFYTFHLLYGGPPPDATEGRQQQLAVLLRETLDNQDFVWSPAAVGHLAKAAARRGRDWEPLAHQLTRIRTCETVVAPASAVFTHLLGFGDQSAERVSRRLEESWGQGLRSVDAAAFSELRAELGSNDGPTGERWVGIAAALAAG